MHFNDFGLLDPGDYHLTFERLRTSVLVEGPKGGKPWDRLWRLHLIDNLEVMVKQL